MQYRFSDRRNLLLALIVVVAFIVLAIIGPVFFSKPPHLGAQVFVSVIAFMTFVVLAGFHLAPNSKFPGWLIPAAFVTGYVVLFILRDGDFRPDQHWFVMSPLGYVAGALALGVPDLPKRKAGPQARTVALEMQTWSRTGKIEPLTQQPIELVRCLDGHKLTLIRLRQGLRSLEIAGGLNGRLVVFYSHDLTDEESWSVYVPNKTAGTHEQLMYVGYVQGYFPQRLWCSVTQVRPLVTEFTAYGRIDVRDDPRWVNDGVMAGGTRPSLP